MDRGDYRDFDVSIWADDDTYFVRVTGSPAGTSTTVRLPLNLDQHLLLRLENAMLRSAARARGPHSGEEKLLREFGQEVFDAVFRQAEDVASLFDRSVAIVDTMRPEAPGLRLRLRIEAPELAQLPWEYLYDRRRREWLGLSRRSPIVRFLDIDRAPREMTVAGPLNVLGMIANPGGPWALLDTEEERHRIDTAIAPLQRTGQVNFCWVPGDTDEDLLDMIHRQSWHVFHFIGHGGVSAPDPAADPAEEVEEAEGFVVFADGAGGAKEVRASDLKVLLEGDGSLRLVLLNCCEGARPPAGDVFASAGAALVRSGVPAVVAMQFPISDEAAIQLAKGFYEGLAQGAPLEQAVTQARQKIHAKSRLEWGIPVLYTRSATGRLFAQAVEPPAPRPAPRPGLAPGAVDARKRLQELFRS